MRATTVAAAGLLALVGPKSAHAEVGERPASAPAHGAARPLLVLLHGDRQLPSELLGALRAEAARRDVALYAPACPAPCPSRSFWQRNPDPAALADEVDAAAAKLGADPRRVAIIGWSGGATYLGVRFAELGGRYRAVAVLGGGALGPGCPAAAPPTLFVEGDHNPLHALARELADGLRACRAPVTWRLLPGADHQAEWAAVTGAAGQRELFDFVLGAIEEATADPREP
jgi:pimeloyl-ACP methyl ester carboxylesterase